MRKLALIPVLLLLAACASVGIAPADTFGKRVIVANSLVEGVVATAETLYDAGKLSAPEARNVADKAAESRHAIEVSREVYAANPLDAQTRLDATIKVLQILQATLEAKR